MGNLHLDGKEVLQLRFSAYENKLVDWRATDMALHDVLAVLSDACAHGLLGSELYLTVSIDLCRHHLGCPPSRRVALAVSQARPLCGAHVVVFFGNSLGRGANSEGTVHGAVFLQETHIRQGLV